MAAAFGMIGLGTMGLNLVLNIADKDIPVCGYDRDAAQREKARKAGQGKPVQVADSAAALVEALSRPRCIMMLVPAGKITDAVIDEFVPLLEPGDILIDGGNSHFTDTDLRIARLKDSGIHFTGMGVSGGEEGARKGPSLMPGGDPVAFSSLKTIFDKIAAQTEEGPCVTFVGNGSAGHYTKMVHNGIEYALMQLISEVYGVLKTRGGMSNDELQQTFAAWNNTALRSFLVEITAEVLSRKDDLTGNPLVDMILDKARQKGTGMWTSQSAMDLNVPLSVIDTAVSMRYLSSLKEARLQAAGIYPDNTPAAKADKALLTELCKDALHWGFLVSYAQGLHLLAVASASYQYNIVIADVIRIWKGGCIIRSVLLNELQQAYRQDPSLLNVILSPVFQQTFASLRHRVQELLQIAGAAAQPMAALASSLHYFDAFRSAVLPANLVQAQRDFFGAHTYERTDRPGIFHTQWEENPETNDPSKK